ncbi:MAG: DUF6240 domain-containing protein [Bacillota bacterium]|nr:DUF6240 domain-containing protein [Bacillota bacterium]
MNILLDGADNSTARTHTNIGRETTSYRTPGSVDGLTSPGFALDISGTVMDNSAYTGHGRTAEEIMLEAGQVDITARRNYMAVMSNTMSDEDFARLQKEGFHPGSTDVETVVTIVDHIKAALVKGGVQVTGYTDDISEDVLKEITGSEAFARELEKQFTQRDIPITEENVAAVMEAWNLLEETPSMTDGSMKYMVENHLLPTPENLYTAGYSSSADASRQGKGYYAAGEISGYYAKKPETVDVEKLLPQIQRIIEEAGYAGDESDLADAGWLIEKGIPLTADTFSMLKDIKQLQFPLDTEEFLKKAAGAIADGTEPVKMNLNHQETIYEQAVRLSEQVSKVKDEAADVITAGRLPFTLKNLLAAQYGEAPVDIRGRRLLEEVRLSMTVEANLRLLRKGYQIETAPLEELVSKLKEAEAEFARALTGETEDAAASQKANLYEETLDVIRGIKSSPAEILPGISYSNTLKEIYETGNERRISYEKAGEKYEELMTAPRHDMGDSIQKAFRNVDDILSDMELDLTDENRRAVRILGYNRIEVTKENIAQVKEMDELLKGTISELKPGRVLHMIREGINPLNMSVEELSQYLKKQEDPAKEIESYSKFLYKLEKQNGISEEERSAYIGIYRLVHQIEKADDAAVGAIWQSGARFTLENLLSAVRSSNHKRMDYSVDDSFGGIQKKDNGIESITGQIAKGYPLSQAFSKEQLQELVENAGDEKAEEEFDKIVREQALAAVKTEDAVIRQLTDYNQPVSADNLLAASVMMKTPREIWKRTADLREQPDWPKEMGEKIIKALEDSTQAKSAYSDLCSAVQDIIEEVSYGANCKALDVKAMSTLYKQMSFLGRMAREENYEIPAQINGSLTSINLKIIHNSDAESKASITLETEEMGRIAAELKMTEQGIEGLCICSKEEGLELLREGRKALEGRLSDERIGFNEIYFAVSQTLNLEEFSLKQSQGRQQGTDTATLYKSARAFIGYVQEIGMKKGNTEYEDQF